MAWPASSSQPRKARTGTGHAAPDDWRIRFQLGEAIENGARGERAGEHGFHTRGETDSRRPPRAIEAQHLTGFFFFLFFFFCFFFFSLFCFLFFFRFLFFCCSFFCSIVVSFFLFSCVLISACCDACRRFDLCELSSPTDTRRAEDARRASAADVGSGSSLMRHARYLTARPA